MARKESVERAAQLALILQRLAPDRAATFIARDVMEFQRLQRSLHRLGEQQCNGFQDFRGNWDEKASERADRKEERLQKQAEKIAENYPGMTADCGGDPRGTCLKLVVAGERGDGWGDGYAVY
jgi:hypothetical protein